MATLLEKIAAKKALAAGQTPMVNVSINKEEEVCTPIQNSVPQLESTQPKITQEERVLTFAEKLALKKAEAQVQSQSLKEIVPSTPLVSAPAQPAKKLEEVLPVSSEPDPIVDPKVAQAYVDIKAKITMLSDMSDADLPNAMKELKAALMQNPQACYLMLPQDIGQMVIALRQMRQEATVEAAEAKEKGPKKSKASKSLTAEEIAAAFDSL